MVLTLWEWGIEDAKGAWNIHFESLYPSLSHTARLDDLGQKWSPKMAGWKFGQQGASSSGEFHLPGWWLLQLQLRSTTPFPAIRSPNRCTADELYGICNVAWHCNRTGLVKLSCDSWWHAKIWPNHKLLTCRLWWIEAAMSFDYFLKWVWSKLQEEFRVTMGCTRQMMVSVLPRLAKSSIILASDPDITMILMYTVIRYDTCL